MKQDRTFRNGLGINEGVSENIFQNMGEKLYF